MKRLRTIVTLSLISSALLLSACKDDAPGKTPSSQKDIKTTKQKPATQKDDDKNNLDKPDLSWKKKPNPKQLAMLPPTLVDAITIKASSFQRTLDSVGNLRALRGVIIAAQSSGDIIAIEATSGEDVTQGQVILKIDPNNLQAELTRSISQMQLAKSNYARGLPLYKQGYISASDYDQLKTAYDSSIASVDSIKEQLANTIVYAPFNGKMGIINVSVGQYVTPQTQLTSIQDLHIMHADFTAPEENQAEVKVGSKISLKLDAYPNEIFPGKVMAINPSISLDTRTLGVRADVPNPEEKLLPGGFVTVKLNLGKPINVIRIPLIAVYFDITGSYVYQVENNIAIKHHIELGEESDSEAIVTKGLKAGDVIITAGGQKLDEGGRPVNVANQEGQPTKIVKPKPQSNPAKTEST